MAKRLYFISTPDEDLIYKEEFCEFEYFNGFAVSQKQKSIKSLHEEIYKTDSNYKMLEVSTKSIDAVGVALSAFNLKFYDEIKKIEYPLENIFQSSKVFSEGGPYRDLLSVHPKDAKRDERLKTSGELQCFEFNNIRWELEPKTMFYDWIYIKALSRNIELAEAITPYNVFTDIEFNHQKSINCQARAAAIFVSLNKLGKLDEYIHDKSKFKQIYKSNEKEKVQMSFLD